LYGLLRIVSESIEPGTEGSILRLQERDPLKGSINGDIGIPTDGLDGFWRS
jgi:hypothetical protein